VVIPVLNEEENIPAILAPLAPLYEDGLIECIVVDGGSEDRTHARVRETGMRIIETQRGRGRQMNAGAAATTAPNLLFLHADTRLPRDWRRHVLGILADPNVSLGGFRLGIHDARWIYRTIEWGSLRRSILAGMPYGDQALFLRREDFNAVGGYPEQPIMEDFELVKRLHARGQVRIANATVQTSPRTWRRLGVIRTTIQNALAYVLYPLGLPASFIVRWYR